MMPPTSIDGTDITGATIDGTDVQEITVDGQTVFEVVQAVTNSGFVIDDFADNKLTSRDDFATTAWQDSSAAISHSSAFTRTTRPEYTTYNSPTVTNGVFEAEETAGGAARAFTDIGNADFSSTRNVDVSIITPAFAFVVIHIASKNIPGNNGATDGTFGIPPNTVSMVFDDNTTDGFRLFETNSTGTVINSSNRTGYTGNVQDTFDIQISPSGSNLDITATKGDGATITHTTANIGPNDVNSVGLGTSEFGGGTIEIDYAVWY